MKPSAGTNNFFTAFIACSAIVFFLPVIALAADTKECDSKGGSCYEVTNCTQLGKFDLGVSCQDKNWKCCGDTEQEISCSGLVGSLEVSGGSCKTVCSALTEVELEGTQDCKNPGKTKCCIAKPDAKPEGGTSPASQVTGGAGSPTKLTNPLGEGATIYTVIRRVITAFLGMVGALALAVFVYAGVMWMTAGSSDRVQKAQDAMKNAIIGLAMIAFSYAITTFFIDTLTGRFTGGQSAASVQYALPPEPNK